jgi:acetyl/propionyl-CoA carboxylase alpha subunit
VILTATVAGKSHRVEVRAVEGRYLAVVDDRPLEVDCLESVDGFASLLVAGRSHDALVTRMPWGYAVALRGGRYDVLLADPAPAASRPPAGGDARLVAPMPGKVVRVLVERGQRVAAAQGLVVVEAMKMENELKAPRGGTVIEVHVREGQAVDCGALLVVLE